MKPKEKPKYNILQNLGYLMKICWRVSKGLLVVTLVVAALQLLTNLTNLYIAPIILQKVEQTATLGEVLITIAVFTLTLAVLIGLRAYLDQIKCIFTNKLYRYVFTATAMKSATTSYSNMLDTRFLEKRRLADASVTGNSENIPPCAMLVQASELITALIGFAFYLRVLQGLHPALMLLVMVTTAVGFFVNRRINQKEYDTRDERQGCYNRTQLVLNTAMVNKMPKDIRIFHMQPWLLEFHDRNMAQLRSLWNRREWRLLAGKAVDCVLSIARSGIAYGYLIHMVLEKGLSASQFLLYFSAVTGFTGWVTTILDSVIRLHRESGRMCEIREYLEWEEPFLFEMGECVPRHPAGSYELRLEQVSYRYPNAEKDTITHMDLTIRPGEKLAIVGLNGAGKTTLVKLLCGLLDPTEGRVLLNGEDIRKFDRRDYYAMFTAVFQDFSQINGTIAANIAQSETEIDLNRVNDCVRRAGFADAVEKLPGGTETNLGKFLHDDGIELSGGQTQRLMLARALYKDAPILLLDEPTAALDSIAENDMYLRYNEITNGRTAIYISHRLASTRFCDRVLFLQDGSIAEEGTHEELIALNGGYAELFEVQSRYYREGGDENEKENR